MGICSPCCAGSSESEDVGVHKSGFIKMLNSNPFAKLKDPRSEYVYDHAGRNMFEIWESKQFGGSVFNKIKRRDGVQMTNSLKDKVLDFKIEYL